MTRIHLTLVLSALLALTAACGGGGGGGGGGVVEEPAASGPEIIDAIGRPDESFDQNGVATWRWQDTLTKGHDAAIDATGRIFVAGEKQVGSDKDMALWCYLPSGVRDISFGDNGVLFRGSPLGNDYGYAISIDNSGRIVVAGTIHDSQDRMAVWRFLPDGSLDPMFGNGTGAFIHSASNNNGAFAVALDPLGRIVVAGYGTYPAIGGQRMTLWRLLENGELDTSFNLYGARVFNGLSGTSAARSVAVDAEGRILAAGYRYNGSNFDMALWRFADDGVGYDVVTHDNAAGGAGKDVGYSLIIDSNQRILVAGTSSNGSDQDMILWRYDSSLILDSSFGQNGIVQNGSAAGGVGNDVALDVALDRHGRILMTGRSRNSDGNDDMVICRYLDSGERDLDFGDTGVARHHNSLGNDAGSAILLDATQHIVVAGYKEDSAGDEYLALWRYR